MNTIEETEITLLSEGTRIKGNLLIHKVCRIHGEVIGNIECAPKSELTLGETGLVQGNISGETIFIAGCVTGNVHASRKLTVSQTGKIIGDIDAPSLEMEFGSFFDGNCKMPLKGNLSPLETSNG